MIVWVWALVALMAPVKQVGTGPGGSKAPGESKKRDIAKGKRQVDKREEQRKKQKEEEDSPSTQIWKKSVVGRSIVCKRKVDRSNIGEEFVVKCLVHHGLHFLFEPVVGYIRGFVEDFYANMKVVPHPLGGTKIEAKVEGTLVVVSPHRIASYMKYARPNPETIQFPFGPDHPSHFGHKFIAGLLTNDYRLLNKIVHFNLFPRGNDKVPGHNVIELLYAVMQRRTIHFAQWIYDQLVNFRTEASTRASLPFPHMITSICTDCKCKPRHSEVRTWPSIEAIIRGTIDKSKAASQPLTPFPPEVAPSSPKCTTFRGRVEQWFQKMTCQQAEIIKGQQREKRARKEMIKKICRMERKIDYCAATLGAQSGKYYEEPDDDEDNGFDEEAEEEAECREVKRAEIEEEGDDDNGDDDNDEEDE